jgi:CBS domain-containing protein
MRVNEAMTKEVCVCTPGDSIRDCAKAMAAIDTGVLPVAEGQVLVGMITDRDIAVRAIAEGKGPDTRVREVLTRDVLFCYEDQELDQVARAMGMARVRRVPVLSRDNSLVGMLSLGDVAQRHPDLAVRAVAQLSEPGSARSQAPKGKN